MDRARGPPLHRPESAPARGMAGVLFRASLPRLPAGGELSEPEPHAEGVVRASRHGSEPPRGLKRALRVRKVIERTFGEAKQWHGLGRSRYRGWERTAIQVLLTCLVLNARKMARRFKDAPGRGKGPRAMEQAAA
ncbi:MAG TPA: transposase [Calditerricola sp.]